MKYTLTLLISLLSSITFAQNAIPDFLQGTWKREGRELYEHWDKLNDNTLKGFSYELKNEKIIVSEYLNISRDQKEVLYTATVLKQNAGKPINFKLTGNDSAYVFENPEHDFPKKIIYKMLSVNEVFVQVSDGRQKTFSFKMQKQIDAETDPTSSNPRYNKALAQELGADDYGMKSYMLVILKTGTNNTTDKTLINTSFRGHLDNITQLVHDGKMIVAGPLGKNDKNYRGIFILNTSTIEEAEKLLLNDPAVKAGLLSFELYNWYGSAALAKYLKFSDEIWKVKP